MCVALSIRKAFRRTNRSRRIISQLEQASTQAWFFPRFSLLNNPGVLEINSRIPWLFHFFWNKIQIFLHTLFSDYAWIQIAIFKTSWTFNPNYAGRHSNITTDCNNYFYRNWGSLDWHAKISTNSSETLITLFLVVAVQQAYSDICFDSRAVYYCYVLSLFLLLLIYNIWVLALRILQSSNNPKKLEARNKYPTRGHETPCIKKAIFQSCVSYSHIQPEMA